MPAGFWRLRWPLAALVAGALLAGAAAAGYAVTRPPRYDFGTVPAARQAGPAGRAAGWRPARAAVPPVRAAAVTAVPARLLIPAARVDAPVVPVGVARGGTLGIPADPAQAGWWAGGGSPGQATGTTVLAGHVDSTAGAGALFYLRDLRPGAHLTVIAGGHAYRYAVRALRAYPKTSLPAVAIFSQQVAARLVIITCGGPFDAATRHYLENIVAYATPTS